MKVFINESILASNGCWNPSDKDEFESNIQTLLDSLHCFKFFNESEVYFSRTGINGLFEQLTFIDECNEWMLYDKIAQLRERIKDIEADDWSQNKTHRDDHNYIVQLGGGFVPYPANGTSLAEAAEYQHNGHDTIVLNFISSEFNAYGTIHLNRVAINPPQEMTLISINSICNKNETITYYLRNRKAIEYNHNTKHGENHTVVKNQGGEIISPLECTQAEARQFIRITVGGEANTDLFAYDQSRNKFVRFKRDSINHINNAQRYHGFYPHDQKIKEEIKIFLKENEEIFNAFLLTL